jgi:PhnB protein
MELSPYIHFNGQCEEAFKLYEKILGGKIAAMHRYSEAPPAPHIPPEWKNKIMHTSLQVGDYVLMGSDAPPDFYKPPQGFSVSLGIKDPAEAERVFRGLSEGGKISMPFQETFWALRSGMFDDRFGIAWMINCPKGT